MEVLNDIIESKIIKMKEYLRLYFEDPMNNKFSFEFIENNKEEEDDYSNDEADKFVRQPSILPDFHFNTEKTFNENEEYQQLINKEEDDNYVKKKSYLSRNNKYSKQTSKFLSLKKLDTVTSKFNENSSNHSNITGNMSDKDDKNLFVKKITIDNELLGNENLDLRKKILDTLPNKIKSMKFIINPIIEDKNQYSFKTKITTPDKKRQTQKNISYCIMSPYISNKETKSCKYSKKSFKLKEYSNDNSHQEFNKQNTMNKSVTKNNLLSEITNIKNYLIKIDHTNTVNNKILKSSRRVKTTDLYLKLKKKIKTLNHNKHHKNNVKKNFVFNELKILNNDNFSIIPKNNKSLNRKNNFEPTSRSVKLISPPKNKLSTINVNNSESAFRRRSKGVSSIVNLLSSSPIKYNYRQKSLCQSERLLAISPVKGKNSISKKLSKVKTIIFTQINENSSIKINQNNIEVKTEFIDHKKEEHLNQISKHIIDKQNRINPLYLDNFLKAKLNVKSRDSHLTNK
jgi:hypothetical protein